MWRSAVELEVAEALGSLAHVRESASRGHDAEVVEYVACGILALPWFFRIPVMACCCLIAAASFLAGRVRGDGAPKAVKLMPFYGLIHRMIRSTAFLVIFDVYPLSGSDSR